MYTKRIYSIPTLLYWTRHELIVLTVIAAVPVAMYELLGLRWATLPWVPIALVGTAVAFILSFQNNVAYDRAWEARKIWGGIVNSSRAWGFMVNDFVTGSDASGSVDHPELRQIRKRLIMRHIAWMTALRHALRSERPWERANREISNRSWSERIEVLEHRVPLEEDIEGYVLDDERSAVCCSATPSTQLMSHQSHELRRLRERQLVDEFQHVAMQGVLNELVAEQGKSERIKNFPYPRQYATLNSAFLWIFILLIPFGLVREFSEMSRELRGEMPEMAHLLVWMSLPFSVVIMWIFHTMQRIGRVTENPFEGTPNDVPITTIARGIEIDLRQMIGDEENSIPGPIPAKHHTQS